jgi:group II intron reverse transcriptase/maturase
MAKEQPEKSGQSLPLIKEDRTGIVKFQNAEVCVMQEPKVYLELVRERGRKGLALERVYRQLFNKNMYLKAYGKIYRNQGAMTHGVTDETPDGMSLEKIDAIIELMRYERYQWLPARRTYIPKKNGKKRPLGMPVWSDKLVQEVLRQILEEYYEPQFSDHSHGFRPQRGCHTALREIYSTWKGTTWFIEGDISACFDKIDHEKLLEIIKEKIHDGRVIKIIAEMLEAGYMEDWTFNETYSGTPQGGIISPLLSNILLDKLDKYVENVLIPKYTKGNKRVANIEYKHLMDNARSQFRIGNSEQGQEMRKQAQKMPSQDPYDPDYRRLKYVRYADDFLLGFIGPKEEAEEIKQQIREFLRDELKLELSEEKTLITNARNEAAKFLGYEIITIQKDEKHEKTMRGNCRTINGAIGLKVPLHVLQEKQKRYMKNGKAVHRTELINESDFTIISTYQAEFRGIANYYKLASNMRSLDHLKWTMETSLTKTLARKLKVTVSRVYKKYETNVIIDEKTYKGLQVVLPREGKEPLTATWGGIPLKWDIKATLKDQKTRIWGGRTELEKRLLAQECELCKSTEEIEVHHIRALKDLEKYKGREKPDWVKNMSARKRKTLVVCRTCHRNITHGRPTARQRIEHTNA